MAMAEYKFSYTAINPIGNLVLPEHGGGMQRTLATNRIGMERTAFDTEFKRSLTAAIRQKMKQDNLSVSALAKRMGTARTAVRRILDDTNTSITLRSMNRAAQAVGLKIKLVVEPMPPEELAILANRLAGNKNRAEAAKLSDQITEGFYTDS